MRWTFAQAGKTRVRGLELGFAGGGDAHAGTCSAATAYMDSELVKGAFNNGVNAGARRRWPIAHAAQQLQPVEHLQGARPSSTMGGGVYYIGKTVRAATRASAGGGTNRVYTAGLLALRRHGRPTRFQPQPEHCS